MAEELDRLKATRGAHRSVATRLGNEASTILGNQAWDQDLKARLTYIAKSLESKVELLKSLDEKVVAKINVDAIEADIVQSDEIELKTKLIMHKINQLLLNKEREESNVSECGTPMPDREGEGLAGLAPPGTPEPRQLPASSSPSRSIRNGVRPKLPKINLHRFNGDVTKFTSFWGTFESTVHSNEDISDIDDRSNYRPISVLPFVSRVFEKLIYNQLYDYLDRNKLLFSKQSGFRSLHSVVTCLLKCTNDWYLDMDKGQYTAMIFVDLKKAFDTVNHEILLKKLEKYGVTGSENAWFASYLCNRRQFCRVNGVSSGLDDINCGVPQGSCLGPLLFMIYINDLPFSLQSCQVNMYADDTTFLQKHY